MPKISFKGSSVYFEKLQQMERHFLKDSTIEKAVHAGAAIVADKIRDNLEALPEVSFEHLQEG